MVIIRSPKESDLDSILETLTISITTAFMKEGLVRLHEDIMGEIVKKYSKIYNSVYDISDKYFFLVALEKKRVVGLISYGEVDDVIIDNIEENIDAKEIGSIYIQPEYQSKGIGSALIKEVIKKLLELGIDEFVMDCAFSNAQKVWVHKFGNPYKVLKDYWPSGADHYIWYCKNIEKYI